MIIRIIKILGWFLGVIGLISFIVIPFNSSFYPFKSSKIDAGLASEFGDLFGGFVGTIFSFLSVILLLYTIKNQEKEYKEQSERYNKENKEQQEKYNEQQKEYNKNILRINFFKMLDYHNQNVSQLSVPNINNENNKSEHRRAFVQYKIQIHRLLILIREIVSKDKKILKTQKRKKEDHIAIADIAYVIFYYGIDTGWLPFINEELRRYKNLSPKKIYEKIKSLNSSVSDKWISTQKEIRRKKQKYIKSNRANANEIKKSNTQLKINRTNQTNLSVYFKNMYNAIKMVDESLLLSQEEKNELINIYKAQLSNPELYVLLFYLISRFGKANYNKNWQKYQNTYKFFDTKEGEIPTNYFKIYSKGKCILKYSEQDCFKIEYKKY